MKILSIVLLVLAVGMAVALLVLSLWPGLLASLAHAAVLTAVLWFPILDVVLLVILVVAIVTAIRNPRGVAPSLIRLAVAVIVVVAAGLIAFVGIPRRLAFLCWRGSFEQLLVSAEVSGQAQHGVTAMDRRVGIWHVDRCARDPRGGVYVRTGTGPEGLGPDVVSYGFAHRPNGEGTPFGNARHRVSRLVGDWYVFEASDDW